MAGHLVFNQLCRLRNASLGRVSGLDLAGLFFLSFLSFAAFLTLPSLAPLV